MITFAIKDIFEVTNKGVVILVESLENNVYFELTDNLKLGGCELKREFDIPRKANLEENIRKTLLYLTLKHKEDKNKLEIGQIVELTTN